MKNVKNIVLFVLMVGSVAACKKAPVAPPTQSYTVVVGNTPDAYAASVFRSYVVHPTGNTLEQGAFLNGFIVMAGGKPYQVSRIERSFPHQRNCSCPKAPQDDVGIPDPRVPQDKCSPAGLSKRLLLTPVADVSKLGEPKYEEDLLRFTPPRASGDIYTTKTESMDASAAGRLLSTSVCYEVMQCDTYTEVRCLNKLFDLTGVPTYTDLKPYDNLTDDDKLNLLKKTLQLPQKKETSDILRRAIENKTLPELAEIRFAGDIIERRWIIKDPVITLPLVVPLGLEHHPTTWSSGTLSIFDSIKPTPKMAAPYGALYMQRPVAVFGVKKDEKITAWTFGG